MQAPSSLVFGLESSCDETSAAVCASDFTVLGQAFASSAQQFERTGGVIPEAAAREQLRCVLPVIEQCLESAKIQPSNLSCIAVSSYPGLLGSLLVGTSTARMLGELWNIPVLGVSHTFGHLTSTWLDRGNEPPQFPCLTLSASGGHTELWLRTSHTECELLGATRDDAAGEAFDKGAQLLGLPYPGGPAIAAAAQKGDATRFRFPSPLHSEQTLDWSFSGLKTALKYTIRDHPSLTMQDVNDLAASYQAAIVASLMDRLCKAVERYSFVKELHLVGGVSANTHLREACLQAWPHLRVLWPTKMSYCTDNGAMIAAAGAALLHTGAANDAVAFRTADRRPS